MVEVMPCLEKVPLLKAVGQQEAGRESKEKAKTSLSFVLKMLLLSTMTNRIWKFKFQDVCVDALHRCLVGSRFVKFENKTAVSAYPLHFPAVQSRH
mmetsp:Transcript_1530/g.3079  ORF Transcript_1530/g.3079 Transcript_1530/m.3079 type:complete len:96 (-) Transcript_1530:397-684(-)